MPIPTHKERIGQTVSAVASSGLGAFTLSTADTGYKALGAGDDGKSFDILAIEGSSWEVRRDCVYTNTGTSLARGTLVDSSTGSAITFTTAVKIYNVPTAFLGQSLENSVLAVTPGGRLTLTSGTPVTTSDVTGATTIYYTPHIHNMIPLYDGARWQVVKFSEISLALGTLTSGLPYDVFGYLSGGALALELLAWTNGTTRATALTTQDGRNVKSGDATRFYLGSFYTTSTTTTEDSLAKRFLFNAYNSVDRVLSRYESTSSWTYNSSTIRQANASTSNKVEVMIGLATEIDIDLCAVVSPGSAADGTIGIGEDSTTAISTDSTPGWFAGLTTAQSYQARLKKTAAIGYHYYAWLEGQNSTGSTTTFYGNAGIANRKLQAGMLGRTKC